MKKLLLIASGLIFISCQQRSAKINQGDLDQIGQAKINQKDEPSVFLSQAAMENIMQIRSGQIAQHSANPGVSQLAAIILKHYEKAQKELTTIAKNKDLYMPTSVPPNKQSILIHLDSITGSERDYQYIELMVSEHEAIVPIFRKMTIEKNDEQLVDFAKAKLPFMEQHLAKAKKLLDKLQNRQKEGAPSQR